MLETRRHKLLLAGILLSAGSTLVNFKIGSLSDVYFSFVVSAVFLSLASLYIVLLRLSVTKKSLLIAAIIFSVIAHSLILRIAGLSTSVSFQYSEGVPWPHIAKLVVFLMGFFVMYECFAKKLVSKEAFFLGLYVLIVISLPLYWIDGADKFLAFSVDSLDEARYYPAWIGGWNNYAMILSFGFLIAYLHPAISKGIASRIVMLVIFMTILSTQSRGGLWFLILALAVDYFFVGRARMFLSKRALLRVGGVIIVFLAVGIAFGGPVYERFFGSFLGSANPDLDLLQSATSGRTVQWLDALIKLTDEQHAFQYFTGYGVGHYAWNNMEATETEIHNMYLQFFYDFGIFGGLGFCLIYLSLLRYVAWNSREPFDRLAKGLVIIVLMTSIFQGIVLVTQTGWWIAALLAFVIFQHSSNCKRSSALDR